MAQLASNPPKHDLHLSQVLPTVKCSSCNYPVPLDHLCDHLCPTTSPPMPPPSNTAHRNPGGTRSPITIAPVNPPVLRRQESASLRANPNPVVPSRGAPSPAPLRKDVRSPGPPNSVMPPSRTQSPFTPMLASSSSSARQPTPRQSDNWPDVIPGNMQPARFRAQSNAPVRLAPVDARSRSHPQHHPSPSSSGLAQRSPSAHRPRPLGGGVPAEPGHLVRSLTSPTRSTYSSQHFVDPQIDTQSGGMAGMAGVGRRGFAAAARAAMFVAPPMPRLQPPAPMFPPPAPWKPASSSSGRGMDGIRVDGPPLAVLNPSAGTLQFIHFTF
jgi:PDZ and LIM domain protein 5/6/7